MPAEVTTECVVCGKTYALRGVPTTTCSRACAGARHKQFWASWAEDRAFLQGRPRFKYPEGYRYEDER